MGVYVGPADAVTGAPSFTGRMWRQLTGGIWTKGATGSLRTRTGIHPATPAATVTATSTTWTVLPHTGVLDLEASAIAGPYTYSIDTNQTGSVNAAHATLERIDLLSVRLDDPAEGDGTATPAAAIVYTAGTAAAAGTQVAPATPARSMPLAWINVPHSGGGSPTVSLIADRAVAVGGITPVPVGTSRPAAPHVGQYIDDPAAGLMRWNGSAWVTTGYVNGTPGAVSLAARKSLSVIASSGGQVAWTISGFASPPVVTVTAESSLNVTTCIATVSASQINVYIEVNGVAANAGSVITLHVVVVGIPTAGSTPVI